MSPANRH